MALIKFPSRLRVVKRLGLDSGDARSHLDAELRKIDMSIAALKAARAALLAEYREEFYSGLQIAIKAVSDLGGTG